MTVDQDLTGGPDAHRTPANRVRMSLKHLYIILWKNVYIKKLARHYTLTLAEVALIVIMLLGIQEEAVVREPLVRVGDTIYNTSKTNTFWNTQRDQAYIREVYYFPSKNKYLNRLTHETFARLGVSRLVPVRTMRQLMQIEEKRDHPSKEKTVQRSLLLLYRGEGLNDTASQPVNLHVSFLSGRLPFDLQVGYRQRLIAQPEGPVAEQSFPEIHTLLPVIGALQQRHLELQADRFHYEYPVDELRLQRFPFPAYIEHRDLKNYALVLTRFCFGVLIPFTVLVAKITDEKATGIREMMRASGVKDWVYWASHYLTSFFMHLIIVTLMLLFVCVKRNSEGRAFIQYSDPTLVYVILMFFCSQCMVHGMFFSTFFANPHSAMAGGMLYWMCSCVMPFLMLEHAGGQGYYYIERRHKLMTAIFPGMSLHWSFRVLERFEKFVPHGANWGNFYDAAATPDNVTLAEIVGVAFMFDCVLAVLLWYLDNVFSFGPGIHKPFYYPLMIRYWFPSKTYARAPKRTIDELPNFENEPVDQRVTVDLVHVSKDYDGVVAVDDVNLRIFDKQITVLLGHNGAGKTTLLNMIAGFLDPSSGVVLIGGYDIRICTRDARQSIGYCPQNNVLFDGLTVEEHLMFFTIVKGVPLDKARYEVVNMLHETSLIEHRSVLSENLALAIQRRLCTAIAILAAPKLVILDEPTTNMDPEGRREMWDVLLKLRRTTCVLLTTQNMDEADVVADRIAIMANGRIRCCGSPAFLKQRFDTGYRMRINKLRRTNVAGIQTLLQKYSPNARLESDSHNEAIFLLGQIIATNVIIDMFKDLEDKTKELGIESVGLTITSLEDVMVRVGEQYHVHRGRNQPENVKGGRDDAMVINAKVPVVKMVAQTVGSEASLLARVWAILVKRAIHVWRERRMPLFSWILPPALLSVLFLLEYVGLRGSSPDVLHAGDTLSYSFPEVIGYAEGFQQADTEEKFLKNYLEPMYANPAQYKLTHLAPTVNLSDVFLKFATEQLYEYVFSFHFGYQLTKTAGNVLWYNGQIQHCALLTVTTYNDARLRNVTGLEGAQFTFDVTDSGHGAGSAKEEGDVVESQNTYREMLPKVLRSMFFPLVSSLMCSNFILFPIAERALLVKHLQLLTGLSLDLYWTLNYGFDFLFYLGTSLFVLPPLALFQWGTLFATDIALIFSLNLLHGYAALPCVYIISFLFDNPGHGFSMLAILTFIISTLGCLGEVFMEHYADDVDSAIVSAVIGTARQVMRLLPSCSYSRAMTKVLQLAAENTVCRLGGVQLQIQCRTKVTQAKLSLKQCCEHMESPDPTLYLIQPFDVHPYSAFYEVATLSVEGAVVFLILLILDRWLRRADQALSSVPTVSYNEDDTGVTYTKKRAFAPRRRVGSKKRSNWEDTDVMSEAELVKGLVSGQLCVTEATSRPVMIVHRLHKAYGYFESNVVLKDLSFTLRAGECFGLLGANGVGKTTTFRILTGEILPHAGDAYIRPFSVVQETRQFQRYLGYCPQKDGLLDMLTGVETLLLFMRLRGVPMTQQYLDALLDIFLLEEIADQLVSTYSAGNRRKLSLCVSMLGMPRVLLLDEPYVGVGAAGRRRVVKYISALQHMAKMSIVLTSHSLSDVEFLCNRIAILADGTLQCLGSLPHLKEKFGKGFTITVKTYADRKDDVHYQREVAIAVCAHFPQAELVHSYEGVLEFRMSRVRMPWSHMFARMARIKRNFKLQEFFIADTSLEQIFRSVTQKEASEAAAAAAKKQQEQPVAPGRLMASTLGF